MLESLIGGWGVDLICDLGSAYAVTMAADEQQARVIPSVLAVDIRSGKAVAIGETARQMEGRVPSYVEVVRPLQRGVIAEPQITEWLMAHLFEQTGGLRPRVAVTVPQFASEVECRATEEAARLAGARNVFCLSQPLCAALGLGLPAHRGGARAVMDIGAEKTEVALVSMGSVVVSRSCNIGSRSLESLLTTHLRRVHNLLVGPGSAEAVKTQGVSADKAVDISSSVRGRDLNSGLPRRLTLSSRELFPVVEPILEELAQLLKLTLELSPPELVEEALETGVHLYGGGARLAGLPEYLSRASKVVCRLTEEPQLRVAMGVGALLRETPVREKALFPGGGSRA